MRNRLTFAAALAATMLAFTALAMVPNASLARDGFQDDPALSSIKNVQRRAMLSKARAKLARAKEAAKKSRGANARTAAPTKPGAPARAPREEAPLTNAQIQAAIQSLMAAPNSTAAETLKANVLVNNRTGDGAAAGQAEASVAADGNNILVAWNDGQGFNENPSNIQGAGFSSDGGRSFVDLGIPPRGTNWVWTSDPVVTVNEKTHTFYYCALIDSTPIFNGIGVVPLTVSGGTAVWGTPRAARLVTSSTIFLDKQWLVADSTNGNLYLIYTNFNNTAGSQIDFQRSITGGVTWAAPVKLNSAGTDGLVQGARVAVDRAGIVQTVWSRIGPIDVDFFDGRRITTAGTTLGSQIALPSYFGNFGAGAPGFNRERGITFPAMGIDRTSGPNQNRVYVTWNESINFYDDLAGGAGVISEVEPNDAAGTSTLFTPGNTLRGNFSTVNDFDFFRFDGVQGQTLIFFMDSVGAGLDPAFRLLCTDGTTRLAISNLGVSSQNLIVFTLPTTGTYYLRPAPFSTSSSGSSGNYRIRTRINVTGPERGRDHRDIFVTSTTNGVSWSTPTRVNNEPAFYDNWLPEVAVGANPNTGAGEPYVIWYDWKDTPATNCGGFSHVYLARSADGGNTWSETGRVSELMTNWTLTQSNIAPNQGDYLALFANNTAVYPVWADGRNGDPDIYIATLPLTLTPTTASLVSAQATPDRVSLTWFVGGSGANVATVYRRDAGGLYRPLTEAAIDASGRVLYEDTQVTPGASYDYRIGVREGGAESFSPDVHIEVPARTEFALEGARPNPVHDALYVAFTLPRAESATLRLLDVSGRMVREREVGSLGAGRHLVNLDDGAPLPIGMYLLTLTQGERMLSSRVSVVR